MEKLLYAALMMLVRLLIVTLEKKQKMENQTINRRPALGFVNVFGWIMVILTGAFLFASIMKLTMFDSFNHNYIFEGREQLPSNFPFFIFDNMKLITMASGFFILIAFIASIGWLLRQEWARMTLKILLVIEILFTLASAIFGIVVINMAFKVPEIPEGLGFMPVFISIFIFIFASLFIFLYIWLFKKISSPEVREVFSVKKV